MLFIVHSLMSYTRYNLSIIPNSTSNCPTPDSVAVRIVRRAIRPPAVRTLAVRARATASSMCPVTIRTRRSWKVARNVRQVIASKTNSLSSASRRRPSVRPSSWKLMCRQNLPAMHRDLLCDCSFRRIYSHYRLNAIYLQICDHCSSLCLGNTLQIRLRDQSCSLLFDTAMKANHSVLKCEANPCLFLLSSDSARVIRHVRNAIRKPDVRASVVRVTMAAFATLPDGSPNSRTYLDARLVRR